VAIGLVPRGAQTRRRSRLTARHSLLITGFQEPPRDNCAQIRTFTTAAKQNHATHAHSRSTTTIRSTGSGKIVTITSDRALAANFHE
jgi:hypothetical protein